jgi:hypothetical protein
MYKNASQDRQAATRRHPMLDRSNSGGVDDSVWSKRLNREMGSGVLDDVYAERQRLVKLKLDYEDRVRRLSNDISEAQRRYNTHSERNSNYGRWMSERNSYVEAMHQLNKKLSDCKVKLRERADREYEDRKSSQLDRGGLETAFMQLAKEMLAGPVYDRVMIAALHRVQEQFEAKHGIS